MKSYAEFALNKTIELLSSDSPSGFTDKISEYLMKEFTSMGFICTKSNKGSVLVKISDGCNGLENGVLFEAHTDTLGAMVSSVKDSGRLKITNIGGLNANNTETENVRIYTRTGCLYEGTLQLENASAHVNEKSGTSERNFDNVEVVIDENVSTKKDVLDLGINSGDYVCIDPRTRVTSSGYIKSRFLDDKLSVGCLFGLAKYIKDTSADPDRPVYFLITVYEEVGHGGASFIPEGITEAVSVDMGCVGESINCTERQVSICAKDSGGPYDYDLTNRLIEAAKKENADYAVDIYPRYGSDVESTLRAGYDIRHGLIGPGVYASHGYERSHIDGVLNTIKLLKGFLAI